MGNKYHVLEKRCVCGHLRQEHQMDIMTTKGFPVGHCKHFGCRCKGFKIDEQFTHQEIERFYKEKDNDK